MTDPFYNSEKWRALRRKALRRDGYFCQDALRYGKRKSAEVVHHIYPREEYPQYALCLWNLISLSASAHRKMHNPDGTLSEDGIRLADRLERKMQIPPYFSP